MSIRTGKGKSYANTETGFRRQERNPSKIPLIILNTLWFDILPLLMDYTNPTVLFNYSLKLKTKGERYFR